MMEASLIKIRRKRTDSQRHGMCPFNTRFCEPLPRIASTTSAKSCSIKRQPLCMDDLQNHSTRQFNVDNPNCSPTSSLRFVDRSNNSYSVSPTNANRDVYPDRTSTAMSKRSRMFLNEENNNNDLNVNYDDPAFVESIQKTAKNYVSFIIESSLLSVAMSEDSIIGSGAEPDYEDVARKYANFIVQLALTSILVADGVKPAESVEPAIDQIQQDDAEMVKDENDVVENVELTNKQDLEEDFTIETQHVRDDEGETGVYERISLTQTIPEEAEDTFDEKEDEQGRFSMMSELKVQNVGSPSVTSMGTSNRDSVTTQPTNFSFSVPNDRQPFANRTSISQRPPESEQKETRRFKDMTALPAIMPGHLYRPATYVHASTSQEYKPLPPLSQLPRYPKLAFPRKWGAPLTQVEPRTVLAGFSCPPVHKYRPEQLLTQSYSTLMRYYNKACTKSVEWVKVNGRR